MISYFLLSVFCYMQIQEDSHLQNRKKDLTRPRSAGALILDFPAARAMINVHCLSQHLLCVCSVVQSCPTLYHPMGFSLPGSSVHEIVQARILEWVAISYSRGSSQPKDRTRVFCNSCFGRQFLYHSATWVAQSHFSPR